MANKQYVVIGLGRFGSSVAQTLYSLGNDVLVIDKDEDLVQDMSDSVTHAVQMDATDEGALRTLGIRNFDVAIITIGGNIQSSIMATLLVKELGINHIVAKANNDLHAKVLKKIGADRVILPEKDMGVRVAHNISSSSILDYIELSTDYSIIEIKAPREWLGKTIMTLKLRSKYGINVMAIKNNNKDINISPLPDEVIHEGDVLVAVGGSEDLVKLEGMIVKLK
ncbi:potassium channel family protein [Clostridium vincentii]|uniref:Ktr system potassium uptake protein A n=1 Tax=Clostridium vincentii TaxID=52704 RepID=A0A2T0BG72_9CLOT|nr:TrkA family potassium uptake protein [Clostridium vincentii]PRR82896.1 Ktr system potassium uptake protein A [Clostridium vincentii]